MTNINTGIIMIRERLRGLRFGATSVEGELVESLALTFDVQNIDLKYNSREEENIYNNTERSLVRQHWLIVSGGKLKDVKTHKDVPRIEGSICSRKRTLGTEFEAKVYGGSILDFRVLGVSISAFSSMDSYVMEISKMD